MSELERLTKRASTWQGSMNAQRAAFADLLLYVDGPDLVEDMYSMDDHEMLRCLRWFVDTEGAY